MTVSGVGTKRQRRVRWIGAAVAVLVAGAGLGWAGATVLRPADPILTSTDYTFVKVVPGNVGSSIGLNTVAEWTSVPAGSNLAAGTVTTVNVQPGQEVRAGAVLYTVNLRPVVVAQGDIPAFRSLATGAKGADIVQLQNLLATLGLYEGVADGNFGAKLSRSVKAWQKSIGVAQDGVVQSGDIVFVPILPTRVALDTEVVKRGASLSGGEPVVKTLPAAPVFTVPVTDSQAALMPIGTRVEITGPKNDSWEGFVTDQHVEQSGSTVILAGKDGASICAEDCASIPATGKTLLLSRVVTVESVSGLTVPSAALLSKADGSLVVIDNDDVEHRVTVRTSARGISVIEGVPAGTKVRIPAVGK